MNAQATIQNPVRNLYRVASCLLLGSNAQLVGRDINEALREAVGNCTGEEAAEVASAISQAKVLHAPLAIARWMASLKDHRGYLSTLLPLIVNRPDQICWLLSYYMEGQRKPLPMQLKKGLCRVIEQSNWTEYHLGKYKNGAGDFTLRDAWFLPHPRPTNASQAELWGKLLNKTHLPGQPGDTFVPLAEPDTVALMLAREQDRKARFERLLNSGMGVQAILRNLQKMLEWGVSTSLISAAMEYASVEYLLPLQVFKAAKYAPTLRPALLRLLERSLSDRPKLAGTTAVILDISGSMNSKMGTGESTLLDAAVSMAAVAMLASENPMLFLTAGNDGQKQHATMRIQIPSDLLDWSEAVKKGRRELGQGGIFTRQTLEWLEMQQFAQSLDRIIVVSDSADCDYHGSPAAEPFTPHSYIVDISHNQTGIQLSSKWTAEVSGFSDGFINFILALEAIK